MTFETFDDQQIPLEMPRLNPKQGKYIYTKEDIALHKKFNNQRKEKEKRTVREDVEVKEQ